MTHKSGYAAIVGKPNAGKSTLLNAMLGQKISITTSKPQTTRKRILGILSEEDYQVIFFDTPGVLKPAYLLQEKMMDAVNASVSDADVVLVMLDISEDFTGESIKDEMFAEVLAKVNKPKILIVNKIDVSDETKVKGVIEKLDAEGNYNKIIPISALLNANIKTVIESVVELLPEGPVYYPEGDMSDENERFFVSEIIREKILELYKEEIPYSTEVLITEFIERENSKDLVRAEIIIERDSQKAIIIGKHGTAIKRLGETARKAAEEFLQKEIFLELHVRVRDKWRTSEKFLKSFGYTRDKEE